MKTATTYVPGAEMAPIERDGTVIFGVAAWQLMAGWALFVMVGYMSFLIPIRSIVYPLFMLSTATLFAIGIVKQRPGRPLAFWVFFAGAAAAALGDFVYYVLYGHLVGHPVPYPSLADGFYSFSYPFFALGLVLLVRRRRGGRDIGSWIDTAVITTGVGLVVFVYLVDPHLHSSALAMPELLALIAAPIMDVVILGILARLMMTPGARTLAYRALVLGFALFLLSDMIYSGLASVGTYTAGGLDLGWMAARALLAIAVLHPSVRDLVHAARDPQPTHLSLQRLMVLASFALVGPVLFLSLGHERVHEVAVAIALASALLFLLVIARMAGLIYSLRASMDRLETEHVARRALARRTLWTSERERNRLASELHDGPVQQLTALAYRFEALRAKAASDGRPDAGFDVAQQQLATEVAGLRQLMTALRPGSLVERGLEAPIIDHIAKALNGSGIVPRVHVDLPSRPDQEIETIVYRVVQDAIANAVRSAHATTLEVSLSEKDDVLRLTVSDDGDGSEPDMSDLGLLSMKERIEMTGGTFQVSSTRGAGTTVEAEVPMKGPYEAEANHPLTRR